MVELLNDPVGKRAHARYGSTDLARILASLFDEIVEGFPWCVRSHEQDGRAVSQLNDRLVIVRRLICQIRVDQRLICKNLAGNYADGVARSEEHTSELQSLMSISYAVFCLKKKKMTEERS